MAYVINYHDINSVDYERAMDLCENGDLNALTVLNPVLSSEEWAECCMNADKNKHVHIIEFILQHKCNTSANFYEVFRFACRKNCQLVINTILSQYKARLILSDNEATGYILTDIFLSPLYAEFYDVCDIIMCYFKQYIDLNYVMHGVCGNVSKYFKLSDFTSPMLISYCNNVHLNHEEAAQLYTSFHNMIKYLITHGATDHSHIHCDLVHSLLCDGVDVNDSNCHANSIKHNKRIRGLYVKKTLNALQISYAPLCDAKNISIIVSEYIAYEPSAP